MTYHLWCEIAPGQVVECMSTDEAAQWLGKSKATLSRGRYREESQSILIGRDRWWPVEWVFSFKQSEYDRRYRRES